MALQLNVVFDMYDIIRPKLPCQDMISCHDIYAMYLMYVGPLHLLQVFGLTHKRSAIRLVSVFMLQQHICGKTEFYVIL